MLYFSAPFPEDSFRHLDQMWRLLTAANLQERRKSFCCECLVRLSTWSIKIKIEKNYEKHQCFVFKCLVVSVSHWTRRNRRSLTFYEAKHKIFKRLDLSDQHSDFKDVYKNKNNHHSKEARYKVCLFKILMVWHLLDLQLSAAPQNFIIMMFLS